MGLKYAMTDINDMIFLMNSLILQKNYFGNFQSIHFKMKYV